MPLITTTTTIDFKCVAIVSVFLGAVSAMVWVVAPAWPICSTSEATAHNTSRQPMTRNDRSHLLERSASFVRCIGACLAAALLGTCASPSRLPAVPPALQNQAVVPNLADIRYLAPDFGRMQDDLLLTVRRERAALDARGERGPLPPISFLAISGGDANGAFGAGLLVGWTQHGDRPKFNLVTGVSTGALIGHQDLAPIQLLSEPWTSIRFAHEPIFILKHNPPRLRSAA